MPAVPLDAPVVDATPLFDLFRGNHATELLTVAVAHFNLFGRLAQSPRSADELASELGLAARPLSVLLTALRAFELLRTQGGQIHLTPLASDHLVPGARFDIGDYFSLAAGSPGVLEMVERLKTNRPAGAEPDQGGAAFIYREGVASAMENEASARHFTLALAGRAKNVAPTLAERVPLSHARTVLDVAGGTGLYAIAFLLKNPNLRAIVLDRPEVLKVAAEMAQTHGVSERLILQPGDMFADTWPQADVILFSNVLHDWDIPECRTLIGRAAATLPPNGQLLIHDVFLNDALDGPLPIALYSAALFCLTEGRAYSAGEYKSWLIEADLEPGAIVDTRIHCGVLPAVKRS